SRRRTGIDIGNDEDFVWQPDLEARALAAAFEFQLAASLLCEGFDQAHAQSRPAAAEARAGGNQHVRRAVLARQADAVIGYGQQESAARGTEADVDFAFGAA